LFGLINISHIQVREYLLKNFIGHAWRSEVELVLRCEVLGSIHSTITITTTPLTAKRNFLLSS
jgi:hypothetical protein